MQSPYLLKLSSFSISLDSAPLLNDVDVTLMSGDIVGLTGANGCGKSTLLRALAGDDRDKTTYYTISAGAIAGSAVGVRRATLFVEQDNLRWSQLLLAGDNDDKNDGNEEELRSMTVADAVGWAAANDSVALDDVDSWRRIAILAENAPLNWKLSYENTKIANLSPGCAVRAFLSIALHRLSSLRILLLDEPTNHLDLASILWLQYSILAAVAAGNMAVVVVSHDEAFLDAVCNHIWSIDDTNQTLVSTTSKYSSFLRAKELAIQHQREAYEAQQARHEKLTAAANRLRDASTTGAQHVGSDRDKLLMQFRRDRAGRSGKKAKALQKLRDSEAKVERVWDREPLRIELKPLDVGIDSSISIEEVELGYENRRLELPPLTLCIDFGERVAIVGANGCGKSTLLKTITGCLAPLAGSVAIGRELRIGNLTQEHVSLPRNRTARDNMSEMVGLTQFVVGQRLMRYGIARAQLDKAMRELNPGARARCLLASFALRNVNALVLDEPSNHLDDEALEEVSSSLNSYEGTVVVVSHNRHFLESLELTRLLCLDSDGLREISSLESYVGDVEEAVQAIVVESFK